MKLYTKTGDEGSTALFGGQRVSKSHRRVAAYGTLDEANSFIGLAAAAPDLPVQLMPVLEEVMSDLFDLGAELATPPDEESTRRLEERLDTHIGESRIVVLEEAIDRADANLPPLKTFVLPTGTEAAARLHVARTQVRRAERAVVELAEDQAECIRPEVVRYLNRVSDLMFVLARLANHESGRTDTAWRALKERKSS